MLKNTGVGEGKEEERAGKEEGRAGKGKKEESSGRARRGGDAGKEVYTWPREHWPPEVYVCVMSGTQCVMALASCRL